MSRFSPAQTLAAQPHLTALAADWLAGIEAAEALDGPLNAAESRANAAYPPYPAECQLRNRSTGEMWELGRTQMETWAAAGYGARMLAAYDAWLVDVANVDRLAGLTAMNAASNAAWGRAGALADRIIATRPATPAEAAIKFAALLWRYDDGVGGIDEPGPIFAFAEDLAGMARADRPSPAPATTAAAA